VNGGNPIESVIDDAQVKGAIRVGIIGSGYMAREYCKVIQDHPKFLLTHIYSRSKSRSDFLSNDYGISTKVTSVEEMSLNPDIDLIVIAVSESSIREVVTQAVGSRGVLLVEKPFGLDFEEAKELTDLTSTNKMKVFVALNRRFYASTTRLRSELELHRGPGYFILQDQHDVVAARQAGFDDLTLNNWMFANAIHTVDLINYLGRGSVTLESVCTVSLGESSFVVRAGLAFTSGDYCDYISIWNSPGHWTLNAHKEDTRWVMRPLENIERQRGSSRQTEPLLSSKDIDDYKPGLWNLLSELSKFWEGTQPNIPTPIDSLRSMELVSEIFHQQIKGSKP
jgi:predicted dehydrogenase